jgi:catechol 2,3-dioxygenase-like lactoylglutathione lyase family enzyme
LHAEHLLKYNSRRACRTLKLLHSIRPGKNAALGTADNAKPTLKPNPMEKEQLQSMDRFWKKSLAMSWQKLLHFEKDGMVEMAKNSSGILAGAFAAAILLCGIVPSQPSAAQDGNSQPAAVAGLAVDHISISVKDLEHEAKWYQNVLGFKLALKSDTNPDFRVRQLRIPGYRIDLIKFKGSVRPAEASPRYAQQGFVHMAFNVPDLAATLKQLQAWKADVGEEKDAKGMLNHLLVHDPEGNEMEVFPRK